MEIRFNLDGIHNRTLRDWNDNGRSPMANMRRHAKEHGAAGAWRANDSFLLIYRDGERLRQKTWEHGKPIKSSNSLPIFSCLKCGTGTSEACAHEPDCPRDTAE
tara:strand:+ start:248 stop:559 length:312 start_codon:yes stop_codon:yes gene_type:complete